MTFLNMPKKKDFVQMAAKEDKKKREISGIFRMVTVSMFFNRFLWQEVFWVSKIQVYRIR